MRVWLFCILVVSLSMLASLQAENHFFDSKLRGFDTLENLAQGEQANLSVVALNRRYNIVLKSSTRPTAVPTLRHFTGYVRSSRAIVAGTLYKGTLRLEFASRRSRNFVLHVDLKKPKLARLQHRAPKDFNCLPQHVSQARSDHTDSRHFSLSTGIKSISVGVDLDFEFISAHGSAAEAVAKASGILHAVNEIYLNQIPLSFEIRDVKLFKRKKQPYSSSDADILIDQLGKNVTKRKAKFGDVRHLFTGKDTHIQGLSGVVGAAYVGVVCRSPERSFGFTELTHPSVQSLVTAHELAHNLGAGHDYATPSLMYPRASATHQQFSDFSIYEIMSYLATNGSCLSDVTPKLGLSLSVRSGGSVRLSTSPSHFSTENCQMSIYAATRKRRLKRIAEDGFEILGGLARADVGASVLRSKVSAVPNRPVYVRGVYQCQSTRVVSAIERVKINPAARKLPIVSAGKFIRYLR